jgi:DNA polymerase-1
MTHVLDENLIKYDLKTLVMDWLGVPKEQRKEFYPNLGKIGIETQPIDEVAQYLAKDIWYTHLYHDANIDMVRSDMNLNYTFHIEMQLYPVLMTMELTGIRIDVDLLRSRGQQLIHERESIEEQIWDICGEEYAITNPHKRRQYSLDR